MKRVEIVDNQTLLDVAMEHYGTAEALGEILTNNPDLSNDMEAMIAADRSTSDFHPDIKLAVGSVVLIDDESRTLKKNVVKKIDRSVNTYMTRQWQELLTR